MRGEEGLSPQEERDLDEWARAEHGSDFLFVTGYSLAKRPFYTHPDPEHPGYTNSFDLLFRGLEAAPLDWYLLAFRHGMPPHGGFAIGLERMAAQLLGIANVREVALFPRDVNRLAP